MTEIRFIIKQSFRLLHIPKAAELTKGTIIPKKRPGEFRIVHVSNALSVVMELIALHRLEHQLDKQRLLSHSQFGFTPGRSRHDLVARMVEIIANDQWGSIVSKSREAGKITTIMSMNIEGAFDNVSQDAIIDKLMNKLPSYDNTRIWLANFILKRRIKLQHNGIESMTRIVQRGVPQGSALGPILFNLAINDIDNDKPRDLRPLLDRHMIDE